MPKVIPFPDPAQRARRLADAVQPYESEERLFETVGEFLRAGFEEGDRLVVIAHPDHCKAFIAQLEKGAQVDVARAIACGHLVCLDANTVLDRFMVGGLPDAERFHATIGDILGELAGDGAAPSRIRAYGEMVDLLWRQGNFTAAIALEELWNEAAARHSVEMLHAYLMGHFYKEKRA